MEKSDKSVFRGTFAVFMSAVAINLINMRLFGVARSGDFLHRYEPAAARMLAGEKMGFDGYNVFHSIYQMFVYFVFVVFGAGSYKTMAIIQIIYSAAALAYLFGFLSRRLDNKIAVYAAAIVSIVFFDNIYWNSVCAVESFYKSTFIFAFLATAQTYERGKSGLFLATSAASFMLLTFIRLDTLFLFLPVYIIWIKMFLTARPKQKYTVSAAVMLAAGVVIGFAGANLETVLRDTRLSYNNLYIKGWVLGDVDDPITIESYDMKRVKSVPYNAGRIAELFAKRSYYLLNIYAHPFWSRSHKIMYGSFMTVIIPFALFGILRSIRNKNETFRMFALIPAGAIILQCLFYMVESSLRQNYTPLQFIIILAAYGLDGMITGRKRLKELTHS